MSSTTQNSTAKAPTPTGSPAPVNPDYSSFSAFGYSQSTSQSSTPQPSLFQQQQAAALTAQHAPIVDPFAALASPVRHSTSQKAEASIFDFANPLPKAAPIAPAADDDEWAFSSALPEGAENTISVSETKLSISLHVTREPSTPAVITMSLSYSNNTDQEISELEFMAAAPKVKACHTIYVMFTDEQPGI
jgi:ADP-ribosylation factor-binding protein GGA